MRWLKSKVRLSICFPDWLITAVFTSTAFVKTEEEGLLVDDTVALNVAVIEDG